MRALNKDDPLAVVGAQIPRSVVDDLKEYVTDRGLEIEPLAREIQRHFRRTVHEQYRKALKTRIGLPFEKIRGLVRASEKQLKRWLQSTSPISFEHLFEAAAATRTDFQSSPLDGRRVFPKGQEVTISAVCETVTMIRERLDGEKRWRCTPVDWAVTHLARQRFWTKVAESKHPSVSDKNYAVYQLRAAVEDLVGVCPVSEFEQANRIRGRWENPLKIFHWLIDLEW